MVASASPPSVIPWLTSLLVYQKRNAKEQNMTPNVAPKPSPLTRPHCRERAERGEREGRKRAERGQKEGKERAQ